MLRLPTFTYHRPKTAAEAVALCQAHGKAAMYVAGGTDLYPNMKRRHQTPTEVISLQDVPGLHSVDVLPDGRVAIGAMVKLSLLEHHPTLKQHYPAFVELYRRGVIGDEHRLSWVESLRAAAADLKLPALNFEIEPQSIYAPAFPLNTGAFDVRVSRMALGLGLLHEGDLERLLTRLGERADGLFSVRDCALRRATGGSQPGSRISAECTLEWYTLELRGSRIQL